MKRIGRFIWLVAKSVAEGIFNFSIGLVILTAILSVTTAIGYGGGWIVRQFIECKDSTESVALFIMFGCIATVIGLVVYSIYTLGRWLVRTWRKSRHET
jgi:hypothetical protein